MSPEAFKELQTERDWLKKQLAEVIKERDGLEELKAILTDDELAALCRMREAERDPLAAENAELGDEITILNGQKAALERERDELKARHTEACRQLNEAKVEWEKLYNAKDEDLEKSEAQLREAREQLDKTNQGFGKLAPKGTWLCEVFENIWRADSVDTAKGIAESASYRISRSGLWVGDREAENKLTAALAQNEKLRKALEEANTALNTCKDHIYSDGMLHHQTYDSKLIGDAHISVRAALSEQQGEGGATDAKVREFNEMVESYENEERASMEDQER